MAIFKKRFINNIKDDIEIFQARWRQFLEFREKIKFVKTVKEEKYQDGFLQDIFEKSLGFTLENTNPDDFNLIREEKNENDGKKADAVIKIDDEVIGVIELKDQKTKDLDKVEDQAFGYHSSHSNSKYIIISNFNEIRLYIDKRTSYEKFELFEMEYEDFVYFYKIMNFKSFQEDLPQKLKDDSIEFEKNISTIFYNDFSELRLELFYDISENNEIDKLEALELSQKILDRFIFILFAEDRYLLNPKISSEIIANWQNDWTERPLYFYIQMLFKGVNSGNARMGIPAYNGGLFSEDTVLDNLKISDSVLEKVVGLSSYDFQSDIDVNILGHIFEQSLDDLEKIREDIESNSQIQKAIRKKDGIFYTPQYITKYIIENSIGTLCQEKKSELGILKIEKLTAKTVKQLEKYRDFLKGLKILDPAVGSGAFLNEAFDFLKNEYIFISDSLSTYSIKRKNIFFSDDFDSLILENNLFGVDINKSAIEISKLSLWLKTAKRDRKLKNLSNNLICANSLLDMPFENGSFDIVVGNPPYGAKLQNEKKEFEIQSGESSILFMQLANKMLKKGGMHGFIIPKPFIFSSSWGKIRDKFIDEITQIVDCGKVWNEVKLEQIIYIFKKDSKFESYENLALRKLKFIKNATIDKNLFKEFGFFVNGVSENEINLALKIKKDKLNLLEISSESNRGGMFQKSILPKGDLKVLGGMNIQRFETRNLKGFIDKNLKITENSFLRENSVLVQRIIAHITKPTDHIKITGNVENDLKKYILVDTVFQISLNKEFSNKFILALLNSKLLNWYVYNFIFAKAIRTFQFSNQVLAKIPIPTISQTEQKPFILLVDKIIDSKTTIAKYRKYFDKLNAVEKIEISEKIDELENLVSDSENEIDKMVFKLYDLNDDEIKLVTSE